MGRQSSRHFSDSWCCISVVDHSETGCWQSGRREHCLVESFENIACTVCGCVCDDLRITIEAGRIRKAEGACALSEPWFLGQQSGGLPVALIEGPGTPLETAVVRGARFLGAASPP